MKILFHGDDVAPSSPEEAFFHIIPVPLEKTVSYGAGTARGPEAILNASCQLELFDGYSVPAEMGIYTASPIDCSDTVEVVYDKIQDAVTRCLSYHKTPIVVGGEHSLTYPVIKALQGYHKEFGVIHFDAHADLRNSYQGSLFSHACVMRRIAERKVPIFQLGTRSYSLEEHEYRIENHISFINAEKLHRKGISSLHLPENFPQKIFISFDVDVFDPSIIPATGTPVPGGLGWYMVHDLLDLIMRERTIIGFDVV
ncbi:MAG: agmatinase, partial [Desulfobacterales bacterium]|nr:agmatinase [Desulfobacterales bacterium]